MQQLITTLRLSRPLYLLLAASTYLLGAGVARYLGHAPILQIFWLGLIGMILAQICMNLLVEVFRPANEPIIKGESIANRKAIHDAALDVRPNRHVLVPLPHSIRDRARPARRSRGAP